MSKIYLIRITAIALGTVVSLSPLVSAEEGTKQILSGPAGRYVFGQISEYRCDQYMLDTKTGRLWQVVMNSDSIACLQPVNYQWGVEIIDSNSYKEKYGSLPPQTADIISNEKLTEIGKINSKIEKANAMSAKYKNLVKESD
jgi:hypothetical protein